MKVSLKVFGATDVGKVRQNNEDAFVIADLNVKERPALPAAKELAVHDHGVLLAVSDGMGGEAAGEVASALVVESLQRALAVGGVPDDDKARLARLETAVLNANNAVFKAAREPDKSGMGATLTAVFVDDGFAHIAEVGDSRAYLIRGSRIRQMTRDQSFVQLLLDSGVLSAEEAEKYPHKNVILQAMGQRAEVKAAIGKLELRRNDVLLLCSDGLSGKVSDAEMLECVGKGGDLEGATKRLIDLANGRGGEDNITVVLAVALGEDLPPPMRDESVTQTYELLQDYAPPPSKPPAKDAKKDERRMTEEKKEEGQRGEGAEGQSEEEKEEGQRGEGAKGQREEEKKAEDKAEPKDAVKAESGEKEEDDGDEKKEEEEEEEEKKKEEEAEEEDDEDEKRPEPIVAAQPNEQQRLKEMLTLAAVFLGIGLLVYFVFKT